MTSACERSPQISEGCVCCAGGDSGFEHGVETPGDDGDRGGDPTIEQESSVAPLPTEGAREGGGPVAPAPE